MAKTKQEDYIFYKGEKLLLSQWLPMSVKEDKEKKRKGYYRTKVFRSKNGITDTPVEYRNIPELKITLIKD